VTSPRCPRCSRPGEGRGHRRRRERTVDGAPKQEQVRTGQVRSFRITKLDAEKKRIDLELVS